MPDEHGKDYLRGFADGLHRAHDVAVEVTTYKREEAGEDIRGFLGMESADAEAHADTGECIASLVNSHIPRCPLFPQREPDY